MADPQNISEAIDLNALGPQKAMIDGESVEMPSLKDLIEADRYKRELAAQSSPSRGVVRQRIVPPGRGQ
jgi:hypothetical protein